MKHQNLREKKPAKSKESKPKFEQDLKWPTFTATVKIFTEKGL